MSASQRNKGAAGEREVCSLIREHLGIKAVRNLMQTREGWRRHKAESLLNRGKATRPHRPCLRLDGAGAQRV